MHITYSQHKINVYFYNIATWFSSFLLAHAKMEKKILKIAITLHVP